ncbi:hypothetical protein CYMTET_25414 [Cymbomonas tetramitiformis]|uniref:Uncharacterized protein n=1 Tax=Cymbomonas tetramitiformis TaxID=36881 RepID=A0AAE0KYY3_9CHLO|nr:hypothetical protein CYMTET_25414 [Cymbomonas tetramitiformis]
MPSFCLPIVLSLPKPAPAVRVSDCHAKHYSELVPYSSLTRVIWVPNQLHARQASYPASRPRKIVTRSSLDLGFTEWQPDQVVGLIFAAFLVVGLVNLSSVDRIIAEGQLREMSEKGQRWRKGQKTGGGGDIYIMDEVDNEEQSK